MKKLTQTELNEILKKHSMWLRREAGGERADLSKVNLSDANLSGADLSGADLSRADLSGANLSRADLSMANLSRADLSWALLSDANLSGANLFKADLSGAELSKAYLSRANLSRADLSGANLSRADLSWVNLFKADLSGVDLSKANLFNATLPNFQIVPEVGPFTAFKKLRDNLIAELYVPRSAQRTSSLIGRKCRVSKVKVKSIIDKDGKPVESGVDKHTGELVYKVGAWVKSDKFDDDIRVECTHGIHCFITRKEAEEY